MFAGLGEDSGEIDIDDPAADGEVAGNLHLIESAVSMLGKPDDQFLRLKLLARLEGEHELSQLLWRWDRLHDRLDGSDQDAGIGPFAAGGEAGDEAEAIGDLLLAGAAKALSELKSGKNFRAMVCEKLNVVSQILRFIQMSADQQGRAIQIGPHRGDHGGNAGSPQPGNRRSPLLAQNGCDFF